MKKFKIILLLLAVSFSSVSCLVDDEDETLDIVANTPYVVGFIKKAANESYFEDLGAIPASYKVDLIGGQDGTPADTDLVLNYTVNPASTAVEGVEYDIVSTAALTIPANSDFATFDILLNTANFDLVSPTTLIIDLVSVDNEAAVISTNNQQLVITFVGCQADLDQFTYNVLTIRNSTGAVQNSQQENINMTAVNEFRTETVGPYGAGAGFGPIGGEDGYDFNVVCGVITVPEQNLVNLYSNLVFGSGSVDQATGTVTIEYTITFGSGDRVYTSTYTRIN